MISSCFRSFESLVMATIGFWLNGLEKKEVTAGWSFPAFCYIPFSFMSNEKWWDFSLWRKDSTLEGHVSSSDLIGQVRTWWEGAPTIQLLLKFGWSAHVTSNCWDLCVGWAGSAGLCSWAPLSLVITTKWRVLPWVILMSFYKSCKRGISWGMNNYISHEGGI